MARIRCKSCGKAYNYQGDCCPHCGAFNRKPQQGYIGAAGDYHAVDEKVCFEEKVCYENQADKAWRDSPDRKPERRGRVKRPNTTRFTSGEANQVIDHFTRSANASAKKFASQFLGDNENGDDAGESFARNFREKTAQFSSKRRGADYASRRERSSGKGGVLVMGLSILIALAGLVMSFIEDTDFSFVREVPAYPEDVTTAPAIPDDLHYSDYGGIFRLDDGSEFTAFTTDAYVSLDGEVVISTFCDGEWFRFDPVIIDERTGVMYGQTRSVEWQENNYQLFFHVSDHDPDDYHYSFHYVDMDYDEMYLVAELSSDGTSTQNAGTFYDIPLLDGEMLYASVLMEYDGEGLLTVHVLSDHEDLPVRFTPYLQQDDGEDYYEAIELMDNGMGEYRYVFDVGIANFDRTFTFVYLDEEYNAALNVASYEASVDGEDQWGTATDFTLLDGEILHTRVMMHYDQRRHEIVVYAVHDGDPERFHPHLSKDDAEVISLYGPPIDVEDRGEYGFRYRFDGDSIEPDSHYTFCYLDGNTGDILYTESLYLPEPPGSKVHRGTLDLSDGTVVEVTAHYTYTDQVLTAFATHDGNMARLRAFAYDTDTGVYHDVALIEDDGDGNYTYTFELSACDASSTIIFGFEDMERSRKYFVMDCFAW